jgi:hypothetical protein
MSRRVGPLLEHGKRKIALVADHLTVVSFDLKKDE